MWVYDNPNFVFYYQEHGLLDLKKIDQEDAPFTLWYSIRLATTNNGTIWS
jgi:hypothetical protein